MKNLYLCRHCVNLTGKLIDGGDVLSLARWPDHFSLAEEMDVQMLDSLLPVLAAVDHRTISVLKPFGRCYVFDLQHHVAHQISILVSEIVQRRDVLLRHYQYMYRRLRLRVPETRDPVIFIDHLRRDLSARELAKNTVFHISTVLPRSSLRDNRHYSSPRASPSQNPLLGHFRPCP